MCVTYSSGHANIEPITLQEGEQKMLNLQYDSRKNWRKEYEYLFDDVLLTEVWRNSRSMSYIPASPTLGYVKLDPYTPRYHSSGFDEIHGSAEHYGYSAGSAFNVGGYPKSRCVL